MAVVAILEGLCLLALFVGLAIYVARQRREIEREREWYRREQEKLLNRIQDPIGSVTASHSETVVHPRFRGETQDEAERIELELAERGYLSPLSDE